MTPEFLKRQKREGKEKENGRVREVEGKGREGRKERKRKKTPMPIGHCFDLSTFLFFLFFLPHE